MSTALSSTERTATRLGETLGGEITGIDLASPSADDIAFINSAWHEHHVLRFRGQALDDDALLNLASALGGTQEAGSRSYYLKAGMDERSGRVSRHAGISIISNLDADGKPVLTHAGTGSLELTWHTDNSYVEVPPKGTMLYSLAVPVDGGGNTEFANMQAAYDTLPEDLQSRLADLHIKHDTSRNTAGRPRPGVAPPTCREAVTGPVHPILRRHPETSRVALYLGRRYAAPSSYIVEMPNDEGDALLDRLWKHATHDRFQWSHSWRDHDLILWDNRSVMHRRTAADPTQPRVMHRALVRGEPIVPAG